MPQKSQAEPSVNSDDSIGFDFDFNNADEQTDTDNTNQAEKAQAYSEKPMETLKRILPPVPEAHGNMTKRGKQWNGPCPKPGCPDGPGTDRFIYFEESGHWLCNQCNRDGGDVVDYHKWMENLTNNEIIKKYLDPKATYTRPNNAPKPKAKPQETPDFTNVWEAHGKDNVPWDAVLELINRRGFDPALAEILRGDGQFTPARHKGKECLAIKYPTLDGSKTPAIQYLTVDESMFPTNANREPTKREFGSGHRPSMGFFQTGYPLKSTDTVILFEAPFNAISVLPLLCKATIIATGTSSLSVGQANALKEKLDGHRIVVWGDNDTAGNKFAESVSKNLGCEVYTVEYPEGTPGKYDANDLFRDGKGELFKAMVEDAKVYQFRKPEDAGQEKEQNGDQIGRLVQARMLAMANGADQMQVKPPLPPFGPAQTQVRGWLTQEPAPMEFILNYGKQGLIPKGIVGVLTATGGTGKTFLLLTLGYAVASGKSFGPLRALKPTRTLIIVAEDPQEELARRLWKIGNGHSPEYLYACSIYGELGPLMSLNGSTPVRTDTYAWLEATIQNHPGLELLILDPKSRLYGLDENNNDHATQWIQNLESLAKKYDLTILFSHHTSKNSADKNNQHMARGASAIVDGCRWQAGLVHLDKKMAEKLDISPKEARNIIEFDVSKSNYAAGLPSKLYFERNDKGVLSHVNLKERRLSQMAPTLRDILAEDGGEYTLRDLRREKEGKHIADEVADNFEGFSRRSDMNPLVLYMLENGMLFKAEVQAGKKTKEVLKLEPPT